MSVELTITAEDITEATDRLELDTRSATELLASLETGTLTSKEIVAIGLIATEQRESAIELRDESVDGYDLIAGAAIGELMKIGDLTTAELLFEQASNV